MDKSHLLNALVVSDVWDLVIDTPPTIAPDAPLEELLAKVVEDTRTRHVYVVDDAGCLVGWVGMTTVTGLLFPMQALGASMSEPHLFREINLGGHRVREVMDLDPPRIARTDSLSELARRLLHEKVAELPVVDGSNRLLGEVNMYEVISGYLRLGDE